MYIHNYQIHNVLNAYRKQLSQNPAKAIEKQPSQVASSTRDMVTLSEKGQQPSIVNKISAEIVNRIAQFGPESEFDEALAQQLGESTTNQTENGVISNGEFTYTLIDEQNQKTTHKLTINSLETTEKPTTSPHPAKSDENVNQKLAGYELPNTDQDTQLVKKG